MITYDDAKRDYAELSGLSLDEVKHLCVHGDSLNTEAWQQVLAGKMTEEKYYNLPSVMGAYIRWHYEVGIGRRWTLAGMLHGRVFNFSCGVASECLIASEKSGIDIDVIDKYDAPKNYVAFQIKKYGLKNIKVAYPTGQYDIILLLDVLEHVPDPVGVLRNLKPYLKRNTGKILCRAPFDSGQPGHLASNEKRTVASVMNEAYITNWEIVEV